MTSNDFKVNELVSRAKQNDLEAFEELVVLYQDKLFGQCYQLTRNYDDAQDLAQEVFVRAYKGLDSFRQRADLGTWLYRIAVNTFLNSRRREPDVPPISLDATIDTDDGEMMRQVAATTENPLEELEQRELRALLDTGLEKLSPEFRAVLVLREFEEYTYDEIAETLDCSLGTVKSRLNRARRALKEELVGLIGGGES